MSRLKKARKQAAAQTESAVDRGVALIGPYVSVAEDKGKAAAKYAAVVSKDLADRAKDNLEDALDRVGPVVDDARHRVQEDVVPKLRGLIDQASDSDVVKTATKRGTAALAAVKGELELPIPAKKKSKGKRFVKVLGITALIAGAVVAVRKLLTSSDSDWTAHQPSSGYTATPKAETLLNEQNRPATPAPAAASAESTDSPAAKDERPGADSPSDVEAAATTSAVLSEEATDENLKGETPQTVGEVVEDAEPTVGQYGEGSYAGDNPPEGFTIKGNERSMKYHVPESGGYDRTIADVWFDSEERASAAGFTRAQR